MTLWLAAMNPEMKAVVEKSGLFAMLGRERLFLSLDTAVQKYESNATSSTSAHIAMNHRVRALPTCPLEPEKDRS